MQDIRDFPAKFGKAISSPAFYQEVVSGKVKGVASYFLTLTVLLALVKTVVVVAVLVPTTNLFLAKIRGNIVDLYPADLVIKITNGQVSTNGAQPYTIPYSQFEKILPQATTDLATSPLPPEENFLVIDSRAKVDDFPKYKTFFLLTGAGLVMPQQSGVGYSYQAFTKDTNITIDRRIVRLAWSRVSPLLIWVVPAIAGVVLMVMLLYYPIWQAIYLIFGAGLLVLAGKMVAIKLSFKSAYRMGVFAITVPLLVDLVLGLVAPGFAMPLLFTGIFLVFGLVMLRKNSA